MRKKAMEGTQNGPLSKKPWLDGGNAPSIQSGWVVEDSVDALEFSIQVGEFISMALDIALLVNIEKDL